MSAERPAEPDAGDVKALTEAEREALFTRARELNISRDTAILETVVGRILAARLAADRTATAEQIAQAIEAERDKWEARFPVPEGWDLDYILRRDGTYSGLDRAAHIARGEGR